MHLGVAEEMLTSYVGDAINAMSINGAENREIDLLEAGAVKARSVADEAISSTAAKTVAAATPKEIETAGTKAEKSMLTLTEVQLNSVLKTSLSEGKKKTSSGLNPATSKVFFVVVLFVLL